MKVYVVHVEFGAGAYLTIPVKAPNPFVALRIFRAMNEQRLEEWGPVTFVSCRALEDKEQHA